jgi:hypothetical protein
LVLEEPFFAKMDFELTLGRSRAVREACKCSRVIRGYSELLERFGGMKYVARLSEFKSSVLLKVKGKAALVLQDAEGYQELLERLDRAEGRGQG